MRSQGACQAAAVTAAVGVTIGTFADLAALEDGALATPLGPWLLGLDVVVSAGVGFVGGILAAEALGCGPSGRPGSEGDTRQEEKLSLSIPLIFSGAGLSSVGAIERINVKKGETNLSGFIPAFSGLGLTIAGLLYLFLPRKNDQPT